MSRIVVTGATSFIGINLINRLKKDHQIIAVVRRDSSKISLLPKQIEVIYSDMAEYGCLAEKIQGNVDIFVHLAWEGTRGESRNDEGLQRKNYICSLEALKSAFCMHVSLFLSAGSQAEYGPWLSAEKLDESCSTLPNTEYGKYKLLFCNEASRLCNGNFVRFIEPRFFSLYGPKDSDSTMIISILRKMLNNEDCELTECIQTWNFLYIDDAIDGLILLMQDAEAKGIYNFGNEESYPLRKYIEDMYIISKSKSKLKFGVVPYPQTGMVNINPDVERLKNLGWQTKTSFSDGIVKVIRNL